MVLESDGFLYGENEISVIVVGNKFYTDFSKAIAWMYFLREHFRFCVGINVCLCKAVVGSLWDNESFGN